MTWGLGCGVVSALEIPQAWGKRGTWECVDRNIQKNKFSRTWLRFISWFLDFFCLKIASGIHVKEIKAMIISS